MAHLVNAHDLAVAYLHSLNRVETHNKAYNLSGGQTLAYVDMVRRIFETLDEMERLGAAEAGGP